MPTLRELFKQGVTKVCSPQWDDKDAYMRLKKGKEGKVIAEVFTKDGAVMAGKETFRVPWEKIAETTFWVPYKE